MKNVISVLSKAERKTQAMSCFSSDLYSYWMFLIDEEEKKKKKGKKKENKNATMRDFASD